MSETAGPQLEELERQLGARLELRRSNSSAHVEDLRLQIARGTLKLKSDIKKSSAFVKKLKTLAEGNAEALAKDVVELNLTRYVSECVAALAEAPIKMADMAAAVKVISLLHQRYDDFSAAMVAALVAAFDAAYGSEDKSKMIKRRIILRLLSEVFLAGVFDDVSVIVHIIQRIVRREGGNSKRSKGNMSTSGGSSSQLEVPLLVSFAKAVGVEFLGVQPKKYKELEGALSDRFTDFIANQPAFVPQSAQTECLACYVDAYEMICKFYLAQHATVLRLDARNEKEEANRGEISDAHVAELEQAKLLFEKLQASVNSLADALDREVPPLPLEKKNDESSGSLLLWEGDASGRAELRTDGPFDDEDTRSFYEDLPDLLELVPAVVLGLTEADMAELKKKKEAAAAAGAANPAEEEAEPPEEAEVEGDDAEEEEAEGDEAQAQEEAEELEQPEKDGDSTKEQADAGALAANAAGGSSSASVTTSSTGSYHHQVDAFFGSLEDLVNRDRCDKAAVEFCYRNSKANRNRLVKTLFAVPRTHLELLAYYSRLVATLQSVLKDDIGNELVDLLADEFNYLFKKRNQFRLESKIKNIRFLAELVKFRICPPFIAFRCLKKCFSDFQGHNVHVATALLENCGRFLYCSKHTHVRTASFLSIMMKLKAAKHLDPQAETLVENAYYMCKPPERVERAVKQYDPLYLFVRKCLYQDLNDANSNKVVKTLRKLPWQDPKTCPLVLKAVLKVTQGKVMHMKWICEVVRGLARYHDELSIMLVDDVLDALRCGLEVNDYRDHQRSLGYVKLLGELCNSTLVNTTVVLETLYLLINHSHDLLTLPQYSTTSINPVHVAQRQQLVQQTLLVPDLRYDPRVPSEVDGPSDVFRIRLVCALIEACTRSAGSSGPGTSTSERGISPTRLARFIVFFQRYVFSKTELPLETDFLVLDLLDSLAGSLRDQMQRFSTWEEADAAVQAILRMEFEDVERRMAKKNAMNQAANVKNAVEMAPMERAGGEDEEDFMEEDELSDDDDDDDDDEEEEAGAARGASQTEGDCEEEDDDDDDEDEDDDDDDSDEDEEEDEEEEEQLIIHDRMAKTEEDDVFEKAFKAMMQGSAETRKPIARVNVDKMAIPTVVRNAANAPVAPGASPFSGNLLDGSGGVVFRMLRRGNKGKVEARALIVPEESSLGQHSHRQEHAGKKEQSELKRLVLQNIERDDFFITPPTTGLDVASAQSFPSLPSRNAPAQPAVDTAPRAGYGGNSEWNNAEFGLRRGRGYRGSK